MTLECVVVVIMGSSMGFSLLVGILATAFVVESMIISRFAAKNKVNTFSR